MTRLLDSLRNGTWLTPGRLAVYPPMVLALSVVSVLWILWQSSGLNGPDGQPIGTDFSNVYAAGRLALEGRAADAYDWGLHGAVERSIFGPATPYYGWHYPPMFLMVAAPLALLPYLAALALWQALSFAAYLASLRLVLKGVRGWLVPAMAFPAVLINLGHGQNGFLTAALIGGGLALLPARPLAAGLLLGALCYKPQFVLLIPLALLAAGQWRALLGMLASAGGLAVASLALFGDVTFRAFAASAELTRTLVLEQGSTGWYKIQSTFSAARNWGASVPEAYAAQGAVALLAVGLVVLAWRRRSRLPHGAKAATLIAAALAATPYSLDYDMMALAPAIAFLASDGLRRGFRPFEASLLVAIWAMPLVARIVMMQTAVPLGALATLTLLLLAAWPAGISSITQRRGDASLPALS